jgi:hypothetical protein
VRGDGVVNTVDARPNNITPQILTTSPPSNTTICNVHLNLYVHYK